jgi:hypothetical protein
VPYTAIQHQDEGVLGQTRQQRLCERQEVGLDLYVIIGDPPREAFDPAFPFALLGNLPGKRWQMCSFFPEHVRHQENLLSRGEPSLCKHGINVRCL